MRYQNLDRLDTDRLESLKNKFHSPKINRALKTFLALVGENLPIPA